MVAKFNPIFAIATMFALTQILGLISGILLMTTAAYDENVQALSVSPIEDSNSPLNALLLIVYVLVGAGMALLVMKYFRTKLIFRFLELGVVGGTVSILIFSFIFALTSLDFLASISISILLGGAFALAKFALPRLKNTAAILSSAGVAAMFGFSMGFWPALLFIVALSLYDYIAVFKTKHMLTLAQGLSTNELSFTVTASEPQKTHAHEAPHAPQEVSRLDLGSGDLAVPAILAVSAYPVFGLFGSLATVIGSILSIIITLHFVVKYRIVLPALPPICLGSLIALLISQLLVMVF